MARVSAAFAAMILMIAVCREGGAQPKIDPQADQVLKRMSDFLAKQPRFTVNVQNETEAVLKSGQKLEFDAISRVSVQRPNKIRSDRQGEIAENLSFFYDGKAITLFGRGVGYYATTPAPGTIDGAIDFARDKLDIEAPGSDLLYSNVYQTLLPDVVAGKYIGKTQIDGVTVHHLAFQGAETDWQIWVEDGDRPLPRKYVITSKKVTGKPDFSVAFQDWNFSPKFSQETFAFEPPENASRIQFAGVPESKPKGTG